MSKKNRIFMQDFKLKLNKPLFIYKQLTKTL
jgi:hypothetical protein